jgi:hypothetical protein
MRPFCKNQSTADYYEHRRLIVLSTEQRIRLLLIIPPLPYHPKLRQKKEPFPLEGAVVREVLSVVDILREDLERPEVARADYHGVAGCRAVEGIVELYIWTGR